MKKHICLWIVVLFTMAAGLTQAADINWVGGGTDNNWSTGANWSPADTDPTGDNLFYDVTDMTTLGTVNGTVDSSYNVASMKFDHPSTASDQGHTIEITSGNTLTVSGTMDVGRHGPWPTHENNKYVTAMFTGGGQMVVNGAVTIRNAGADSPHRAARLDVSGLSQFTVDTAASIHLGGTNNGRGELILSPDNLLKAASIYLPGAQSWATGGLMSSLQLGQQNTLNADIISVGGYGLAGEMLFQSGLTNPEVTIRDRAGTGAADLYIGDMHNNDRDVSGLVDFTGGTVNAEFDQLQLGLVDVRDTASDRIVGAIGTLNMSAGTIDANNVVLGRAVDGSAGAANHYSDWADGILNLQGGEFTATTITIADDDAPLHDRVRGSINLSDGTLTAGTIEQGDGNGQAAFNWTGGTLHVDTFGFQLDQDGGTLAPGASVGQTEILADYNQAVPGILQIEIEGTGTAGVDYDLVTVAGTATLLGDLEVLIDPGYDPQVGDFFDVLTATASIDAGSLTLGGQGTFTMAVLANPGGGQLLRLTAVPEPSTLLLLLCAAGLLAGARRRRR